MIVHKSVYREGWDEQVFEAIHTALDGGEVNWVDENAEVVVLDPIMASKRGREAKEQNPDALILIAYTGNSVHAAMQARALGGLTFNLEGPSPEVVEKLRQRM
jgi:ABC-type branched-subunit amino acid transport system substrate-binding protein